MDKKRVAVYIRLGLKADVNFHVDYYKKALTNKPGCELVEIYVEKCASGKSKNRPMFNQMIADAKAKKFDYIICNSVSKFSRDAEFAIKTIAELKECGVGIFFEKEHKDTLSEEFTEYSQLLLQTCGFAKMLREKEKEFEAEHPEWLDDEEPDENDLAQIINTEI